AAAASAWQYRYFPTPWTRPLPSLLFSFPFSFGKTAQGCNLAKCLSHGLRGRSGPALTCGYVVHHATSSGKLCAVADCNVVRNAHAPAKHHHIADRHRPRYASIPGNHAGAADLHIMRDLHKIIDLAALANDRVRQGAAINCGIRSDLNVVLDDDTPDLWVLFKALWSREKAETVLPHLRARMDNHPVADDSELNRGLRADETVAADRAAVSNHGIGSDDV